MFFDFNAGFILPSILTMHRQVYTFLAYSALSGDI